MRLFTIHPIYLFFCFSIILLIKDYDLGIFSQILIEDVILCFLTKVFILLPTHTHTHTLSLSLVLSLPPSLPPSLSLSLSLSLFQSGWDITQGLLGSSSKLENFLS